MPEENEQPIEKDVEPEGNLGNEPVSDDDDDRDAWGFDEGRRLGLPVTG